MSKQLRKIARKKANNDRLTEVMLFGELPPTDDETAAMRKVLIRKFNDLMRSYKSNSAPQVFRYLREAWLEWDPKKDGMSAAMDLFEDVQALRDVEREDRLAVKEGTSDE